MGEMTNEQAVRWLKDLLKSDLPMEQYQTALEKGIEALEQRTGHCKDCKYFEYDSVAKVDGIPLDDVKAEISEEICLTDNPYTKETKYTIEHIKLLEILDNIGKVESEE